MTSKELRDKGYLSDVRVNRLMMTYDTKIKNMLYNEEVEFLETNEKRNTTIAKLGLSLEKNTLIMVNHLEHGFELERLCTELNESRSLQN